MDYDFIEMLGLYFTQKLKKTLVTFKHNKIENEVDLYSKTNLVDLRNRFQFF